ncbi:MAG: type II toxin-antitoxin system RelE/ParE family toxin [Candidatus Doudnabacteria bacterium]|nr:type II toxin-antitoxin system RelE/ParE family toxin [Candidatus Doudnabacteria bacterium]
MRLTYTANARKQLTRLPRRVQERVVKAVSYIELNPYSGKKLLGELSGRYSYRVWPYRIIYTVDGTNIYVTNISHRQGVYK